MKKLLCLLLSLILLLSVSGAALAVNEDVDGELVIFTSMYKEVLPMIDAALKAEFPMSFTPSGKTKEVTSLSTVSMLRPVRSSPEYR